jgi:hypothetical protein
MGKMGSPVELKPESCRKVDKRKRDCELDMICTLFSFTSLFAGTPPTQNSPTMANDSLPDLQEQWQWDHQNQLVVISLL